MPSYAHKTIMSNSNTGSVDEETRQRDMAEQYCNGAANKESARLETALSGLSVREQLQWLHKQPHDSHGETETGITTPSGWSMGGSFPWVHYNTTTESLEASVETHKELLVSRIRDICVDGYLSKR